MSEVVSLVSLSYTIRVRLWRDEHSVDFSGYVRMQGVACFVLGSIAWFLL